MWRFGFKLKPVVANDPATPKMFLKTKKIKKFQNNHLKFKFKFLIHSVEAHSHTYFLFGVKYSYFDG